MGAMGGHAADPGMQVTGRILAGRGHVCQSGGAGALALAMLEWYADVLGSVRDDEFRLPVPTPARDGRLAVNGWCAWPATGRRCRRGVPGHMAAMGQCS